MSTARTETCWRTCSHSIPFWKEDSRVDEPADSYMTSPERNRNLSSEHRAKDRPEARKLAVALLALRPEMFFNSSIATTSSFMPRHAADGLASINQKTVLNYKCKSILQYTISYGTLKYDILRLEMILCDAILCYVILYGTRLFLQYSKIYYTLLYTDIL